MEKQKICIIGGSLTGLVTAISLAKLDCEIDLVTDNINKITKSKRSIAVSNNNFDFLNRLNIYESSKGVVWPCSIMKLYTEDKNKKSIEIFELNKKKSNQNILHMLESSKISKLLINKIKKTKSISIKQNIKINAIQDLGMLKGVKYNNKNVKYNLVIICAGSNSGLVKSIFKNKVIHNSYKELSITTVLKHNSINNNIARQIFLNNGILALLPISNNNTSIVLSIKKNKKINDAYVKKIITLYSKNYLSNIKFNNKIEYKDLNFLIRKKYYKDRILLFGDALHVIHPFVGQGFNMTIRDLVVLKKILKKKMDLGLDIGSSDILSEFSNESRPRNFAFSLSVDILKNYFSIENDYFKELRNNLLKNLNKNNYIKSVFFNIANKGFEF
jgi:2-octaprenyl-6-methoxyphenol hydroxylase